jgi:peptidoglycan biosynthesis protein MviN/MurJ (putative lipid II flippase)
MCDWALIRMLPGRLICCPVIRRLFLACTLDAQYLIKDFAEGFPWLMFLCFWILDKPKKLATNNLQLTFPKIIISRLVNNSHKLLNATNNF